MRPATLKKTVLALAALAAATPALAHVGYGGALYSGDGVYDPIANTIGTGTYGVGSNFNATVSSNAGFITGLDPYTLGNTHDIRFRYFTLDQASQVTFTITGLPNNPVTGNANAYLNGITPSTLNPAFSLYSGVVPASSHDGVGEAPSVASSPATSAYLATAPAFAPWSPFLATNEVRGGAVAGTPGSNPIGLWGVFDSNGDWTTGNDGNGGVNPAPADGVGPYLGNVGVPKVAGVSYLGISMADALGGATFVDSRGNVRPVTGADGIVDNKVTWSGVLGPGIYTLAIGGANLDNYDSLFADVRSSLGGRDTTSFCGVTTCSNLYAADRLARGLSITGFSVTPVPEPSTILMMVSGLGLVGVMAARRSARVG